MEDTRLEKAIGGAMSVIASEQTKAALQDAIRTVLKGTKSKHTKRAYMANLAAFLEWLKDESGLTEIDKHTVSTYLASLASKDVAPATINQRLATLRKLAYVGDQFASFATIKSQRLASKNGDSETARHGLTKDQVQKLLEKPRIAGIKELRDRALIAVLVGCGLKREEIAKLTFEQIEKVEQGSVVINVNNRRVPVPNWVDRAIDTYAREAEIERSIVFRKTSKRGEIMSEGLTEQFITKMVIAYGVRRLKIKTTPAYLRRTFACLAYQSRTPIEQIQTMLGHDSIQNTRLLIGC